MYYLQGPPVSTDNFNERENIQCIPGENMYVGEGVRSMYMGGGTTDLFIHESIKSTNCLDDDWDAKMLTPEELLQ